MGSVVLYGTLFSVFSILALGAEDCLPNYYRDTVTGNCDHCSDICEFAKQQRTVEECHNKCTGYIVEGPVKSSSSPQVTAEPTSLVPAAVVAGIAVVLAVVVVSVIVGRRTRTPPVHITTEVEAPPPEILPLCPVVQCTEQNLTSSAVSSTVDIQSGSEEAYGELPENSIYATTGSEDSEKY